MQDPISTLTELTADLVRLDSRSFVSNLPVAERLEAALAGFEVERLDYRDPAGVAKRCLIAHRGPAGGLAFSGHMDTVPVDDESLGVDLCREVIHGFPVAK